MTVDGGVASGAALTCGPPAFELAGRRVVVTGGSRGLGAGLTRALVERGADVAVVSRGGAIAADATDPGVAARVLAEHAPALVVLNAGAVPPMAPIDEIGWDDFSATWNVDVRAALVWTQAVLRRPLDPGSLVLLVSSGASVAGSPLSGGYAGAKRTLWYLAAYADELARQRGLDVRFRVVVPMQMVAGTGVGDAGLIAYAAARGVTSDALARTLPELSPDAYGRLVVDHLVATGFASRSPIGIRGDTGATELA